MKTPINRIFLGLVLPAYLIFHLMAAEAAQICEEEKAKQYPFLELCNFWIDPKELEPGGAEAVEILKSRVLVKEFRKDEVCQKILEATRSVHCFSESPVEPDPEKYPCKITVDSKGNPGKLDMGFSLDLRSLDFGKYAKPEDVRKKLFKLVSTIDSSIQVDLSNNNLKDKDLCELNPKYSWIEGIKKSKIVSLKLSNNPGLTTLAGLFGGFPALKNLEVSHANLKEIGLPLELDSKALLGLDLSDNPSLGKNLCKNQDFLFFGLGWVAINVANSGFTCLDAFIDSSRSILRRRLTFLTVDGNHFNSKAFVKPDPKFRLNNLTFFSAERTRNFPFALLFGKKDQKNFPILNLLNLKSAKRTKYLPGKEKFLGVPVPFSEDMVAKVFQNPNCRKSNVEGILPVVTAGNPLTSVSRYPLECKDSEIPGVVIMP